MWFESIKPEAKYLLFENELVAESVQKKAQQGIATTACCITESLQRQPFFKRLIKKIDDSGNLVMNHNCFFAARR